MVQRDEADFFHEKVRDDLGKKNRQCPGLIISYHIELKPPICNGLELKPPISNSSRSSIECLYRRGSQASPTRYIMAIAGEGTTADRHTGEETHAHKEREQQRRLKREARQPMKSARDPLGAMANAAGETTGQREAEERDRKQEMDKVCLLYTSDAADE